MIEDTNNATRGVLFDLDGVVIDTEGTYAGFWDEVNRRYPTGVENFSTTIKGMNLHGILTTYFDAGVRDEVRATLEQFQAGMHFDYFPGAVELLRALRSAGVATALVTSSDRLKMEALAVQHPELAGLFDGIVTGDMVTHAKPHPECFLLGARIIGRPIERCVVVEDSLHGLRAGMAAGARVVGLTTTYTAEAVDPLCHLMVPDIGHLTAKALLSL